MSANALMCDWPRPWIPATPSRIVSLAPSTLPDACVPATTIPVPIPAVAAARFRKARRVWRDINYSFSSGLVGLLEGFPCRRERRAGRCASARGRARRGRASARKRDERRRHQAARGPRLLQHAPSAMSSHPPQRGTSCRPAGPPLGPGRSRPNRPRAAFADGCSAHAVTHAADAAADATAPPSLPLNGPCPG